LACAVPSSGEYIEETAVIPAKTRKLLTGVAATTVILGFGFAYAQQGPRGKSSYMQVEINEPFSAIFARLSGQKPEVTREHMAVLNERYDLSNRPVAGVTMDRAKPVQDGVRVKLPAGKTWEALANMSPDQIRDQNLFPKGFYPLPHPKHEAGGFVFPHFVIDEIKRQEDRDLTRFSALGDAQHGFPYLSGGGRLVLKDIMLLAGGLLIMADSARAFLEVRPFAKLQTMTASRTSTAPAE
jgi:hypothetical protein